MFKSVFLATALYFAFSAEAFTAKNCAPENLVVDYEGMWDFSQPFVKHFRLPKFMLNRRIITTDAMAKVSWEQGPLLTSTMFIDLQAGATSSYYNLYRWEISVGGEDDPERVSYTFEDCEGMGRRISVDDYVKISPVSVPASYRGFTKVKLRIWGHQ